MYNRTVKLFVLALLHAAAYHFAYVDFLYAVFAYFDFRYEPTSTGYMVWTYLAAALPVLATRESNEPSAVGCALIFVLSYVPVQLTMTFMWAEKTVELFVVQVMLILSMVALFRSCAPARAAEDAAPDYEAALFYPGPLTTSIHVMTVFGLLLLISEFHSIMKFVSFDNVYDLRSDAAAIQASTFTNYLIMWLTYCFGPFYIARALIKGRKADWAVGVGILFLIYSATASKLALMTPLFMFAMKYIDNGRDEFLMRFLIVVVVGIGFMVAVIPDEGILRWVNSIFLMRVFGSNGWTAAAYYEYFSTHGYTFYNHIGPINAVFGAYPYGDRLLGQEIAQAYFNLDNANFNAGFWASDAFAALGMVGIPIVTFFACLFLKSLNEVTRHFPLRLVNLWLLGFWMALMNVPLSTALLSCGGLLVILLLRLARPLPEESACTPGLRPELS